MSHAVTGLRRSRLVGAFIAATLLVVGAFTLGAPGVASAEPPPPPTPTPSCPKGSFCLWERANFQGGRYSFSGSDSTLYNDRYILNGVMTKDIVAGTASSAMNNGYKGAFDDVLVSFYARLGGGSTFCIPQGAKYPNLHAVPRSDVASANWGDAIAAYKWVRSC